MTESLRELDVNKKTLRCITVNTTTNIMKAITVDGFLFFIVRQNQEQ